MATERGGLAWSLSLKTRAAAEGANQLEPRRWWLSERPLTAASPSPEAQRKRVWLQTPRTLKRKETGRDREGKRQRQTEGKKDSESNSISYSFLVRASHVLNTPLNPGTTDLLISRAKDHLQPYSPGAHYSTASPR